MSKTSDFIVQRLSEWGVKRVFGYPGDSINPLVTSLNQPERPIEFVQARHEEMCAMMATAHAKFTGEIGICVSTGGPGAIHLLNGLYDAKLDNQPVLAIVGQQPRNSMGTSFLQEVDLVSLFKDVAHEYVNVAMTAEQVRHLVDRSIRIAYAERTVTCLILPHDVLMEKAQPQPEREHGQSFSGIGISSPHVVPSNSDLQQAADILNAGEKVAMLVGAGALGARLELLQTAEILGAGVAKALLGKAALEDTLPFVTGSIGMLGTQASYEMMNKCDTFFMVGSNFPYAEFLPKPGSVRGVQIDVNPRNLSLRYPMEVGLIGDTAQTLARLIPLLKLKDRTWRLEVESMVTKSQEALAAQATADGSPVNPQRVFFDLSPKLPNNCIITADSGTSTVWYARHLQMRPGMMGSVSGGLATMGCSIPYAIAAKFAHPTRPVIACSGDGAMQMSGNNELVTIAKYWKEWSNPNLVIIVLKNNDLNFVTWEMRAMEGEPKFNDSQSLPDFPYADYARSLGLAGYKIDSPEMIGPMLDAALACDRPAVVEVVSDANIPPIPPHAGVADAKSMAEAMAKGDPEGTKPLIGAISQFLHSFWRR